MDGTDVCPPGTRKRVPDKGLQSTDCSYPWVPHRRWFGICAGPEVGARVAQKRHRRMHMRLGMLLRWQSRLRSGSSPLRPTSRSSGPHRTGSAVRVIRRPCRIPSTSSTGSGTFEPGHPGRRFMSQTDVPPGPPIRDAPSLPPTRIDSGRRSPFPLCFADISTPFRCWLPGVQRSFSGGLTEASVNGWAGPRESPHGPGWAWSPRLRVVPPAGATRAVTRSARRTVGG